MSEPAVLLCSGTGFDAEVVAGMRAVVVDDLCRRPDAAAEALRELGASRAVLGLCDRNPHSDLAGALRRAGAVPFGVEAVTLAGRGREEAARLVAAAAARLAALAPGDRGKAVLAANGVSRRALLSFAGMVTHEPVAVLDDTACAGVAHCGLCVESCPVRAIDAAGVLPSVDQRACTACGLCVSRCPHGALHLAGSSAAQIEAQLEGLLPGVSGIVFACRKSGAEAPLGWGLVELPTLALLTPGWILQAHARGAQVRLAPCGDGCCAGVGDAERFVARVLAACEPQRPDGRAPIRLGEPSATADAVLRLAPPATEAVIEDNASPMGLLAFDAERCTLCSACAGACPTGALQLDETVRNTTLRHEPGACVACGRCVTACPESALGVRRGIDLARLAAGNVDLARVEREVCTQCGADLPPRPMRRRLRALLPALSGAPLGLCAGCAVEHSGGDY